MGKFELGAAYAQAFLLHKPTSADMLKNKRYLTDVEHVDYALFQAPEVSEYCLHFCESSRFDYTRLDSTQRLRLTRYTRFDYT